MRRSNLTREQILAKLDDHQIFYLTLWAESRGEPFEGILAVACVIRNRVKRRKQSYRQVCLAPWQFSAWNKGQDRNHSRLMDAAEAVALGELGPATSVAGECRTIATHVIADRFRDRSHGADHYYAPASMRSKGRVPPWAEGRESVCTVGRHVFFRLE